MFLPRCLRVRKSPPSSRRPQSCSAVQAKPGPGATAAPRWSPRLSCLQHVPEGSRRCSSAVAAPITLTPPYSPACCSLPIAHSFSCLEARSVGGPSPTGAVLARYQSRLRVCCLNPKFSPLFSGASSQTRPTCCLSPCLSSGLCLGQLCWVCAFLLCVLWS